MASPGTQLRNALYALLEAEGWAGVKVMRSTPEQSEPAAQLVWLGGFEIANDFDGVGPNIPIQQVITQRIVVDVAANAGVAQTVQDDVADLAEQIQEVVRQAVKDRHDWSVTGARSVRPIVSSIVVEDAVPVEDAGWQCTGSVFVSFTVKRAGVSA